MTVALDPAIGWTLSLALALLLGGGAAHKLRDLARFRAALGGYRVLPAPLLPLAAVLVIGSEVVAATLLLFVSTRPGGAALAAGLLGAYALALATNLLRGRTRLDCGCLSFGRSDRIAWWMVGRNVGLMAIAGLAALPSSLRELVALDRLTIGGTVASAALLYAASGRLGATSLERGPTS
ncbi:MAG: MauE/DoxX family redox-associated membrane protein [Gemmatimonadales bacterium]